jgi:peroxidase
MLALVLMIGSLTSIIGQKQQLTCNMLPSIIMEANRTITNETNYGTYLESIGLVAEPLVFKVVPYDPVLALMLYDAKILTAAAQIAKSRFNISPNDFETFTEKCLKLNCPKPQARPKYRAIDGYGNNINNPEWGTSNTFFSRYAGKNYEDGINTIKKSVDGTDLPNARLVLQEVLGKAVRTLPKPVPVRFASIAILLVLFVTHDMHYQLPNQYRTQGIACCSKDRSYVLPPDLSNAECLPIQVSKTDPFYKWGNITCLNMVRSDLGKNKCGVETGEILNRATSYLDLSLIYGNVAEELPPIRLYKDGKLRMGNGNILPVDSNGKYLGSMDRFTAIPVASIWPALFARNHNHLAGRLATLNSHWDDEKVFQEARRINIANIQNFIIGLHTVEDVFQVKITANYSDTVDLSTSLEFAISYRAGHYYIPDKMIFLNELNIGRGILQSDTIDRIDLLENSFDDAFRGVLNQPLNSELYGDEIINRIGKDARGFGTDLIATDIQRARDQGLPSFVEVRRQCNLTPAINSMDDFNKIFNPINVQLLKRLYKSHEDVDFYVGGMLEIFESVGYPLVGKTFGCVIVAHYDNVVSGDIYYYTHPESPYPFTEAQITAISNYAFSNFFCTNSNLTEVNSMWPAPYIPLLNPKRKCTDYPEMDLSAWKEK